MNRNFTDPDNKDSAVKTENIVHEQHHLEKLMKQNQDALEMMGNLMRLIVEKSTYLKIMIWPKTQVKKFEWL